jgi:hypothetical protein
VPTTRPRYTVTDTGEIAEALDLAQRRWPDVRDRRQLLLRLAAVGRETVAAEVGADERRRRRERQLEVLSRAPKLVYTGELLSDAAWR